MGMIGRGPGRAGVVGLAFGLALVGAGGVASGTSPGPSVAAGSFTLAGSLPTLDRGATLTVLPDGRVLVLGRSLDALGTASPFARVWDPGRLAFEPDLDLLGDRDCGYTTTLLADGRVLVVGGARSGSQPEPVASAVIWDPAGDVVAPAGSMATVRADHTATLLPDGRVLVIGGLGPDGPLASAELWDPTSASFSPAGTMAKARAGQAAVLVPDGRVLVVGGEGWYGQPAPAEVWDPATPRFRPTGTQYEAMAAPTASLLPDGRVFVLGGDVGETWDPATGRFRRTWGVDQAERTGPRPATPTCGLRDRPSGFATPLADGRILLISTASRGEAPSSAGILDLSSDAWTETSGFPQDLRRMDGFGYAVTALPDGRALVLGSLMAPSQDVVLDPMTAAWTPAGTREPVDRPRADPAGPATAVLPDGRVLAIWPGAGKALLWAPS